MQRKDFEAFLPKNGESLTLAGNTKCCGYNSLVPLSSLPSLFPFSPPPSLLNAADCGGIPAWRERPPTRLRHARGGSGRAGDGGDAGLPWKALEGGEGS